jgi:putative ABC transport system permease protein
MASVFSLLTILVACLGLYGLVAFVTQLRTKEVGIRKVLGASAPGIVALFAKPFVAYILFANVLAWPLAYFAMRRWLQDFAYGIDLSWTTFAGAGGLALGVALLTVGYQAIRAALADPVDALRYE